MNLEQIRELMRLLGEINTRIGQIAELLSLEIARRPKPIEPPVGASESELREGFWYHPEAWDTRR